MAVIDSRTVSGVLREEWADTAGGTYRRWDGTGVLVETRAFNAAEAAYLAEWQLGQTYRANAETLNAELGNRAAELLSSMATLRGARDVANATINGNPATYIKALANQLLVTDRALVAVARIVSGRVESTDTGTV